MKSYEMTALRYAAIVTLGGFIFGLDAALISGTVRFVAAEFNLTDFEIGAVVSSPGFGVIFALLITGRICNLLGRKKALLIIASLYLVSAIASVFAPNFWSLVVARLLGGLAFTSLSVAAMYIGEVAPANMRGKLVSMNQVNIVVGLSGAYFANYVILQASNSGADWVTGLGIAQYTWRWMLGVEIIPAIIWLLLLTRVPESPRWLIQNGHIDEAKSVMGKIMPATDIDSAIKDVQESASHGQKSRSLKAELLELFDKRVRLVILIGLSLACVQPLTGINAIMFYAPTVFEQTGIGTDAAFLQAVIVGLVSLCFCVLSLFLIDRIGRRPMVLFGLSWAAISLFLCSWAFANATYMLDAASLSQLSSDISIDALQSIVGVEYHSDVDFKLALKAALGDQTARIHEGAILGVATHINTGFVLFAIMSFIASFQFSIGPILWVLFSEIFPIYIRGIAIPFFALITSVLSYVVQQFFPWQLSNMGTPEIFALYGIFVTLGFIVLYKILKETKNKSIEEIELLMCAPRA